MTNDNVMSNTLSLLEIAFGLEIVSHYVINAIVGRWLIIVTVLMADIDSLRGLRQQ